jgi:hypothetical protein
VLVSAPRSIALLNDVGILLQNVLKARLELFIHLQFSVVFEQRNCPDHWSADYRLREGAITRANLWVGHTLNLRPTI